MPLVWTTSSSVSPLGWRRLVGFPPRTGFNGRLWHRNSVWVTDLEQAENIYTHWWTEPDRGVGTWLGPGVKRA